MFEVEQNFNLTTEQRSRLLDSAEFEYKKSITDIYYDTPEHKLSLQDFWLRERDGNFELKVPANMSAESIVDQYQEIEDEPGICDALEFSPNNSLSEILKSENYLPFCTCATVRESYTKQGFTIVIDHVSYAGSAWTFDACEIELLVSRDDEMPEASRRIAEFAAAHGLKTEYLHGKVLEFLYRERPEHFAALVKAGVVLKPENRG
ncbi:MAG: CYTH domain-containing protein [bacterium]